MKTINDMKLPRFTGPPFEVQEDPSYLQNCCNALTWNQKQVKDCGFELPEKLHTYLRRAGVPSSLAGGFAEALLQQNPDRFTEVPLPAVRMMEDSCLDGGQSWRWRVFMDI